MTYSMFVQCPNELTSAAAVEEVEEEAINGEDEVEVGEEELLADKAKLRNRRRRISLT